MKMLCPEPGMRAAKSAPLEHDGKASRGDVPHVKKYQRSLVQVFQVLHLGPLENVRIQSRPSSLGIWISVLLHRLDL